MTKMMQSVGDSNNKQIVVCDVLCMEQGMKQIHDLISSVFLQKFFEG